MKIPIPVIAVVADVLADRYTHTQLDRMMEEAGVPGNPPLGNKIDKVRAWLKRANGDEIKNPLALLGKVLEEFMEVDPNGYVAPQSAIDRERISDKLADHGLAYVNGGHVVAGNTGIVSRSLEDIISDRDLSGLQTEFERIYTNVESDPAAAVTASCALLESLFNIYIHDNELEPPRDRSVGPLWRVVRKHVSFEPGSVEDEDLRKILSGLASIVDGTGSLRTHKGSAHGHGHVTYNLKARHARLAAHSAFTLATFILETWGERRKA